MSVPSIMGAVFLLLNLACSNLLLAASDLTADSSVDLFQRKAQQRQKASDLHTLKERDLESKTRAAIEKIGKADNTISGEKKDFDSSVDQVEANKLEIEKFKEENQGLIDSLEEQKKAVEEKNQTLEEKKEALSQELEQAKGERDFAQVALDTNNSQIDQTNFDGAQQRVEDLEKKLSELEGEQQSMNDVENTTLASLERANMAQERANDLSKIQESGLTDTSSRAQELRQTDSSPSGSSFEGDNSSASSGANSVGSDSDATSSGDTASLSDSPSGDSFSSSSPSSQTAGDSLGQASNSPSSGSGSGSSSSGSSSEGGLGDLAGLAQQAGGQSGGSSSSSNSSDFSNFNAQDQIVDIELASEGIGSLDNDFFSAPASSGSSQVELARALAELNSSSSSQGSSAAPLNFGEPKDVKSSGTAQANPNVAAAASKQLANNAAQSQSNSNSKKIAAKASPAKDAGSSFFLGSGTAVASSKVGDVTGGDDTSKTTSSAAGRSLFNGLSSRTATATTSTSGNNLEVSQSASANASGSSSARSTSRSLVNKSATANVSNASNLDAFLSEHKGLLDKIDSGIAGIDKAMSGERKVTRNLSTTSISASARVPSARAISSLVKSKPEPEKKQKPKRKLNLLSAEESGNFRLAGNGKLVYVGKDRTLAPYQWGAGYATAAGFAVLIFGFGYFLDKRRKNDDVGYQSESYSEAAEQVMGDSNRKVMYDPDQGRWVIVDTSNGKFSA